MSSKAVFQEKSTTITTKIGYFIQESFFPNVSLRKWATSKMSLVENGPLRKRGKNQSFHTKNHRIVFLKILYFINIKLRSDAFSKWRIFTMIDHQVTHLAKWTFKVSETRYELRKAYDKVRWFYFYDSMSLSDQRVVPSEVIEMKFIMRYDDVRRFFIWMIISMKVSLI